VSFHFLLGANPEKADLEDENDADDEEACGSEEKRGDQ
jgi:hypothetical protein